MLFTDAYHGSSPFVTPDTSKAKQKGKGKSSNRTPAEAELDASARKRLRLDRKEVVEVENVCSDLLHKYNLTQPESDGGASDSPSSKAIKGKRLVCL